MLPARGSAAPSAGRAGVGIGEAEGDEDRAFARLHRLGLGRRARGRSPAHAGRRAPAGARSAPRAAMPCSPASRSTTGAQSTRSATTVGCALVVEGQHVGRVVLAAVLAVERAAFLGVDDAHRRSRPARRAPRAASGRRDARGSSGAVGGVGELQRQAERARAAGAAALSAALRLAPCRPRHRPRRCAPPADGAPRRPR